jgi:GTPase Era involved in 16S rRNA processing
MGQSPQVQFTLLGPLNAGKSTLVNHNHIGVTQKF